MLNRKDFSNLGIRVYAVAGIAEGLVGLVWGDFATEWWPVQALPFDLPHRAAVSYIVAACFILGGAAIFWRRMAQSGVLLLSMLYLMSALLWLPRVIGFPRMFGTWSGFLEQFSLVAAGMVAYAILAPRDSPWALRTAQIGRYLYGLCVVSYGLVHFSDLSGTASVVPEWIPPGQKFWAAATGAAFLLASIPIFSGILAVLASRLLTAMIVSFGAFVWAPSMFTETHVHLTWAGNAINLAFIGAAWIIADLMAARQKKGGLK